MTKFRKPIPNLAKPNMSAERLGVLSNAGKLLDAAARGHEALYESETSVLSSFFLKPNAPCAMLLSTIRGFSR